jgi:hypothetical protein
MVADTETTYSVRKYIDEHLQNWNPPLKNTASDDLESAEPT